ncbi:MAG: SPOR domain-containing protein [Oceanicaulis sp.]
MTRLAALLLALSLSACATTPEPSAPSRAQALAALLVETEAANPARIAAAHAEMAALERALTRTPRPDPAPETAASPDAAPVPPAAPDLSGARSVMSAVHIASYRERRHAEAGWTQLEARHAPLSGLAARLSRADLGERGVFLRLKAGPFDTPAAAEAACDAIKASGDWCAVTDFTGEGL